MEVARAYCSGCRHSPGPDRSDTLSQLPVRLHNNPEQFLPGEADFTTIVTRHRADGTRCRYKLGRKLRIAGPTLNHSQWARRRVCGGGGPAEVSDEFPPRPHVGPPPAPRLKSRDAEITFLPSLPLPSILYFSRAYLISDCTYHQTTHI